MRLAPILLCAALAAPAHADILHLADGTTREGRVVATSDDELVVDFGQGSMSLLVRMPRSQVVRVERKATQAAAVTSGYVARLSRAMKGNADDWHALGVWCRQQRCLNDKAREAFERALTLDPNHVPTHTTLGHIRLNGVWMTPKEAVQVLAPDLEETAKARELVALTEAEEARTAALDAQKQAKELEARIAALQKQNADLRKRLAAAPPPEAYSPRVIYRPIIIYRDRPRHGGPKRDGGSRGDRSRSEGRNGADAK